MAEKKKNSKSSATGEHRTANSPASKTASRNNHASRNPDSLRNQLIPCILVLVSLLIVICLVWSDNGWLGNYVKPVLYGLLSYVAIFVPVLLVVLAVFWKRSVAQGVLINRIVFAVLCMVMLSIAGDAFVYYGKHPEFDLPAFWEAGKQMYGGGVIGNTVGWLLCRLIGAPCTAVLSVFALLLFVMLLIGATPHSIYVFCAYHIRRIREKRARKREENAAYQQEIRRQKYHPILTGQEGADAQEGEAVPAQEPAPGYSAHRRRKKPDPDVETVDDPVTDDLHADGEKDAEPDGRDTAFGIPVTYVSSPNANETQKTVPENRTVLTPEPNAKIQRRAVDPSFVGQQEIADIFSDESPISEEILQKFISGNSGTQEEDQTGSVDLGAGQTADGLEIERNPAVPDAAPKKTEETKPQAYAFPPTSLLDPGVTPSNADISEELQTTAKKLVDTLRSFKVRTHIVNVSRGPTITRYELAPEEGIRVRSILNLVDDISLNLATSGVRIEAPIPGKQAVGIEVPNRTVATVYLRRLIENQQFVQSNSRITACLGEDVAGTPIYLDIAKMPHLLIAGATGMGKSVCINSMIVSLLYKASPDEVKLILIDPKKVELNIYNGLPHLLVPVVSDPKKAAGSLQWAVSEMERRFTLIEEVGVRDLKAYNQITKDDPDKEFLPQVVIIIDELADLMMTAPDDVEESICRLAQKARAAGMHLIIGTQRPSVDVITGLIKANIPSRIAFTVASQVDSRTILDITGAEKLIGRGDMLYAPVGCTKPIRVQGAFVSEKEIEGVLEFIRRTYGTGVYNEEVIASIEQEAARCGQSKKGASEGGDASDMDADPMLRDAIELAVETGKISTSLIQRKLSLGYGRAAKLIDAMEARGIVSPPEGQKPRTVLISRQQYMEMVLKDDEMNL